MQRSLKLFRQYLQPIDVEVVLYHYPCSDGFGGAYAFYRLFKQLGKLDDIIFIPLSHTTSDFKIRETIIPQLQGKNIAFVDIAPRPAVFKEMVVDAPNKCIVLDHHKGVQKTLEQYPDITEKHVYFDMSHSGAMIAWEYCFPNEDAPRFIKLIEDRDIWAKKLDDTDAFCAAFYKAVEFDFEEYSTYENEDKLNDIIEEGRIVLKYQKIDIAQLLVPKAVEKQVILGNNMYNVYVINTNVLISDIGAALAQKQCRDTLCDFSIMWYYNHHKGLVKVSMRSDSARKDAVDVSTIAKMFGGNGHPSAAGFSVKYPDIIDCVLRSETFEENTENKDVNKYINPILKACGLFATGAVVGTAIGYKINK